jgi:hypothetical protein
VVFRFGFKAPTGTYSIALTNGVAVNRTYLANFTISAGQANTDTVQTFVIPGDTTGTWPNDSNTGMYLTITAAAGTTFQGVAGWNAGNLMRTAANTNGMATAGNIFELFDVGLYLDPLATGVPPAWQMPDEAQELIACKRYWEKVDDSAFIFSGAVTSGTGYYLTAQLVPKRVLPALSGVNSAVVGFPAAVGTLGGSTQSVYESRIANGTGPGGFWQTVITASARM